MQRALDSFRESMIRVANLAGLYRAIGSLTTSAVDPSDLLRAQVVLTVSALDFYVHEVTLLGMLEIYAGRRQPTKGFEKYRVSVGAMMANHPAGNGAWLEAEIRERHSFLAFQQPDKIADAIRLFTDVKLWQAVGTALGQDDSTVKSELRLIVDRRNKIAHEADLDPSYPGARWPISEADAERSRNFVESLVGAMHTAIA